MNQNTVEVVHGIAMPFFPMRPASGSPIHTKRQIDHVVSQLSSGDWLIQPKAGGERACLAVVDGQVLVQNRHGAWRKRPIVNGEDFLKLRNRTCFDGEVIDDQFHPFECLAVNGRSLLLSPAVEREAVAQQLVKLIHHKWFFPKPTRTFLSAARKNLPVWEGVVMKGYMSFYIPAAKANQESGTWLKCKW